MQQMDILFKNLMTRIDTHMQGGEGRDHRLLALRLSVSAGRRRVSVIRNAFLRFGFELGVCTAQHLMNAPMKRIDATRISVHTHQ